MSAFKSTYDKYNALKTYLYSGKRTIEDCAAYLNKDKRTAYRAISKLSTDKDFRTIKNGRNTLYYMEDTSRDQQTVIIKSLKKILKSSGGSASESRLTDQLEKLITNLESQERSTLPESISINNDLVIDLGLFTACDFTAQNSRYNRFLQAIKECKKIRINYQHSADGETTNYIVCPLKLIMRIDTLYLLAVPENDIPNPKLFVFDQIKRTNFLNETFKPIDVNVNTFYRYAFSKWVPDTKINPPEHIHLEAIRPWTEAIFARARFKEGQGSVVKKGNKTIVKMNFSITPDFKVWLFGMLDAVNIIAPKSLKESAKEYLKEASKTIK